MTPEEEERGFEQKTLEEQIDLLRCALYWAYDELGILYRMSASGTEPSRLDQVKGMLKKSTDRDYVPSEKT